VICYFPKLEKLTRRVSQTEEDLALWEDRVSRAKSNIGILEHGNTYCGSSIRQSVDIGPSV